MIQNQKKLLYILILAYGIYWGVMAISPVDRMIWLVENILPLLTILVLAFSYKKFPLSNLSYLFIFIFLCLHNYAAHFTYHGTPFDSWLKTSFHTKRSYFDRVVHFAFGLLWAYPIRESLLRAAVIRGILSYTIPLFITLSFSAAFEIIEVIAALLAGGQQAGEQYVGLQGDVFDSQKDMGLGFMGALISMGLLLWATWSKKRADVHSNRK